MKKVIFLLCSIGLLNLQSFCQEQIDKFQPGELTTISSSYSDSVIDGYLLYLPSSYITQNVWPIIIYLHGGSGVGGNISRGRSWSLPKHIYSDNLSGQVNNYLRDSFIVVVPHMTIGSFEERQWYNQEKGITEILNEVLKKYKGDSLKVYLTGVCRGGAGTWGLASKMPNTFAAIAPLCGAKKGIDSYYNLTNIPIWVAHSDKDKVIDYSESLDIVNEIEKLEGEKFLRLKTPSAYKYNYLAHSHIFTTFDRESHDAWSGIYDRVEIYKWLLKHKR